MTETPRVLHFDPPQPVYLVDLNGDAMLDEPLLKQTDLHEGIGVAVLSPWKKERCLPGIARGDGGVQYLMELGDSIASLVFHPERGWGCNALVPKEQIMSGLAKQKLEEAKSKSFTQRLVKKAAKRPRTS